MLAPITLFALKELGYFGSADDTKQMKHKNGSNVIIIHVCSCLTTPPFQLAPYENNLIKTERLLGMRLIAKIALNKIIKRPQMWLLV